MNDLWNDCFDTKMGMSPDEFSRTFCRVCRNPGCSRSITQKLSWTERMATQMTRLFVDPKFADPNDPQYADIRKIDFPSAVREAMRLEISDRRGDWTVPTEEDASKLAMSMVAGTPAPPVAEPTPYDFHGTLCIDVAPGATSLIPYVIALAQHPNSRDMQKAILLPVGLTQGHFAAELPGLAGFQVGPYDEVRRALSGEPNERVLQGMQIRGTQGDTYEVSLVEVAVGPPQWRCTCKAFEFGGGKPCKHIEYAVNIPPEDEPDPVETPPSQFQGRPLLPAMREPVVPMPRAGNIPVPTGGIMIDGTSPPQAQARPPRPPTPVVDPWAPPPPKPKVIPVGGRVVLGGGDKK